MNILAFLSVVIGFQSIALAGDAGEAILTKYRSAGARAPQYRDSKTVEVFPMGGVRVIEEKGLKETIKLKGPLPAEVMKKVLACSKVVKKFKAVKYPNCAGSSRTSYFVGEKMVSIRTCGEIQNSEAACVPAMIKILDQF